jgi:hypothetical protein
MQAPTVDIVIVNWNAGEQLRACLGSIAAMNREGYELLRVVVVDNASSDGSAEGLRGFGIPLLVIRNDRNRGFGAACNQGAGGSTADYLLFLNPDTRVYSQTLGKSVALMEAAENRAVAISSVQLIDDDGNVARCCSRFPRARTFVAQALGLDRMFPRRFPGHFYREWDHKSSREVDQVIGAYFLIRRPVFQALNGFDERFFVYFEDVDLSLRARQAGGISFFLAGAQAYHKGRGTSEQARGRRLFYSLRSRLLYGCKHFHPAAAAGLFATTLLLEPFSRAVFAGLRGALGEIPEILQGYGLLFAGLPQLLRTAADGGRQQAPANKRQATGSQLTATAGQDPPSRLAGL